MLVLDAPESFGSQMGRSLGKGLGDVARGYSNRKSEEQRQSQIRELLQGPVQPKQQKFDEKIMGQKFIEMLPAIESQLGRGLEPQELDQMWEALKAGPMNQNQGQQQQQQEDPFARAQALSMMGESDLAKIETQRGALREKERMKKEDRLSKSHTDISQKVLQDMSNKAMVLPQKENALDSMKEAIASGNLGMFSLNNLAEVTGLEGLRSPEGAQFKTASKEFFLGNMSRVGARGLNQWLEKEIRTMAPQIGQSQQANLVMSEILQSEMDLDKKQIELTNQIADQMEKKYGYVKRDLAEEVNKELRPFAIEHQKALKDRIEDIKEQYTPKNKEGLLMRDPAGDLKRVPHTDISKAKKAGYREAS